MSDESLPLRHLHSKIRLDSSSFLKLVSLFALRYWALIRGDRGLTDCLMVQPISDDRVTARVQ